VNGTHDIGPGAGNPADARPSTILVVDDTPDTRRLMRRVLERASLVVLEAENGTEGLAAIRTTRPDAVVLDLRMPGLSGFEVARAVRADPDPAVATTPLLACSASVQAEVQREALDAGCDAFEGKPINIHTFAELVLGLIAQRRPR
jgi:CheY-like chemotaxis protein